MRSLNKDVGLHFIQMPTIPISYKVIYSVLEAPEDDAPGWEGQQTIPNDEKLHGLLHALGKTREDMKGPMVLHRVNVETLEALLRKYSA